MYFQTILVKETKGKTQMLHISILQEHSGITSFSWLYAVERWASNVHIKATLSWQRLKTSPWQFHSVSQIQSAHSIKQMRVSFKEPHQKKMSLQYGML